jgi:hypothetical protein
VALTFFQRGVALVAVALLGAVAALAIEHQRKEEPKRLDLPAAVPAPGGGWYGGPAAPHLAERTGTRTSCGFVVRRRTAGIAHPVLGCGTKLYVAFGSREVLTQVISQRTPSGVEFAVTPRLARLLGMRSTDLIRWRFAAG